MASLSELYASYDTLDSLGLDVQELKEKIEQKENEILSKEVIPSLEEICDILLQSFRADIQIVIEHKAGGKAQITVNKNGSSQIENNNIDIINSNIQSDQQKFYAKTRSGVNGVGVYDPVKNKFRLLAGSKINSMTSNSFNRIDAYREVTSKYCDFIDGFYVLKEDYTFASPSTASSVVLGRSSNGWADWKDDYGRCLNTVYPR